MYYETPDLIEFRNIVYGESCSAEVNPDPDACIDANASSGE